MNSRNIFITTTLILFLSLLQLNAQDKVGTAAANFLGMNVGVAASAMGGSHVSIANDASTLYWNPGALAQVPGSHLNFSHIEWFVDTQFNWAAAALNLGSGNAVGVSLMLLDYGEEEVTTVLEPNGTGARWTAQDLMASITYSRSMTDRFSIGGTLKYISQKIYNETASAVAVDVGLLYVTRFNGLRLGMSISNFGSDMQLDGSDLSVPYDPDDNANGNNGLITTRLKTNPYPLPLFYRVGASMDVVSAGQSSLLLTTDAVVPSDNSTIMNMGVELRWNDMFFLRGGYKSLLRDDTEEGPTAGVGFRYMVPGLGKVDLDYAYNDYGLLEEIHVLGVGFSF